MRTIGLFFIALLLTFCTSETKSTKPAFEEVVIERIYTDSVSIRALDPVDENRVWFAGNFGKVGLIDNKTPKLAVIRYQDSLLHFRAIAKTSSAVFVLSIANPGVLYKIGFDGLEATSLEQVYLEEGEKVFYDAIQFWDDTTGIAMGDPTSDCLSVLLTSDSGNNWTKLSCDLLPKISEGEAAFAASNSNIAVYGTHAWIASGGKKARVFHTPNKGKSWDVYETPIIQGGKMTGIYSIDFYDENTGIIFGGDWENKENNTSNKALTEDGGKTWNLISDGSGPGYRSSVKFIPGRGGDGIVAVGSPGIAYSANRGLTWNELSSEAFFAIEFVNDSIAFASGNNKISKLTFR